jgi:cysteinyl-tRNA synthetase
MHNEMLQVEGKKMSKSLGNFFTVRDLLDKGVPGEVIRYVYLMTHYRKPMDWTEEKSVQARETLWKWWQAARDIEPSAALPGVVEALADDLNTPEAIAELHKAFRRGDFAGLKASANLMGLLLPKFGGWSLPAFTGRATGHLELTGTATATVGPSLSSFADRMATLRDRAVASKDFSAVDALKAALVAAGVEVRMSKADVDLVPGPNFDLRKLEALK